MRLGTSVSWKWARQKMQPACCRCVLPVHEEHGIAMAMPSYPGTDTCMHCAAAGVHKQARSRPAPWKGSWQQQGQPCGYECHAPEGRQLAIGLILSERYSVAAAREQHDPRGRQPSHCCRLPGKRGRYEQQAVQQMIFVASLQHLRRRADLGHNGLATYFIRQGMTCHCCFACSRASRPAELASVK